MAHWSLLSQQTQSSTLPSRIPIPYMQGMWLGTRNLLPHYMWMWGHKLHKILSLPGVPLTPGSYSYHQAAYQLPWWSTNQLSRNSTPWVGKIYLHSHKLYYPYRGTDQGHVYKLLHPSSNHQRRITRQADPLNEEEVLNQRKQRYKSFKKIITFLLMPIHIIM